MIKNLILSAAVGYHFNQIEFFIKSLRKYYFGDVCFIIGQNDDELETRLKKYNCEIIKTKINKKKIQFKRYEIFLEYLKTKKFNNILLCDSRDIYFQAHPFEFNYKGPINFFLEDYLIKDCPYNSNWIIKVYGKNEFEKIANKTILCSGTVLGKNEKIVEYLNLIKTNIAKFSYKKKLKYLLTFRVDPEERGCDQGHANYLVHKLKINNVSFYSNHEGPVATAFYLDQIKFDEKFRLINKLGNPYLLVHQYDKRWDKFAKNVNSFKNNL
ncbi:hypothetical protein OAR89_04165 [Pelagibacteraceae bacterium]|jgi:hypothetical protein|nr:hypothetical protein [Pelagibacteraceae bacterium]